MENEIKLLARHEDLDALLHGPLLQKYATAEPVEHQLADTYYDTPERELRAHRVSLRVRHEGEQFIQSLKAGNGGGGALHQREEYESPVMNDMPALPLLRRQLHSKNGLRALLRSRNLQRRLDPIFSTRVTRTVIPLKMPQGDVIECAIDAGEITGNGSSAAICEVELELKSGDLARLYDLALELSQALPLTMGEESKGERGYALLSAADFTPAKATAIALDKAMSVERALVAILGNCLQQIDANAAGVVRRDSEGLHQMRVGLRRLNSALRLAEDLVHLPNALRTELHWLASQLGTARDWDVLAHGTLGELAQTWPAEPHIAQVVQAALGESETLRRLAGEAVASPRYAQLILMLSQWRLGTAWRAEATPGALAQLDAPVARFARKAVARAHRRLLKRGNALDGADAHAMHRVRIAAKRLRYISEFFQSLMPSAKVRPFVKQLAGLQDEFGRLNDMAVADQLLATLQEKHPAMVGNSNFVRGFIAAGKQADRRAARKSWYKFSPARPPSA